MARLPQPGGDQGNWGTILNEYLSQALTTAGTLKDNVVGSAQLQTNAVTADALADNVVTAAAVVDGSISNAQLADNSIQEAKLAAAVRTKLNTVASGGTAAWGYISGTLSDQTDIKNALDDKLDSAAAASQYATQSVLSANYAPKSNPTFTGTVTVPTPTGAATATTKAYVDGLVAAGVADATTTTKGKVQLAGDLAGTAAAPTVGKLQGVTVNASTPSDTQVLAYSSAASSWVPATVTSTAVNDATTAAKGIVQLAGDLAGTASSPTVAKVAGISVSGAPTTGQVLTATSGTAAGWATPASAPVTSVAGKTGAVTLAKADIGLGNADNTSDINKPISSATQTALNTKAPLASPTFTGTVTVPAPTNTTDAATKAYVDSIASSGTPDASSSVKGKLQLAGDLGGSATSPIVAKVNGVAVAGTPSTGQVLTATGAATATWSVPASAPVSSVAGKTGAVTLAESDVSGLSADLAARPTSSTVTVIWTGTQAAYDAIGSKSSSTLYCITG